METITLRLALIVTAALVLSGCVQSPTQETPSNSDAPTNARAGEVPSVSPETNVTKPTEAPSYHVVTIELSGTIILRPASSPVYEGDAPEFYLYLPPGAKRVRANAEWSPPQEMGLEFHPPGGGRITSWDDDPLAMVQVLPPIEMEFEPEQPGDWWTYIGPGIVGGMVDWTLSLEIEEPTDANMSAHVTVPAA